MKSTMTVKHGTGDTTVSWHNRSEINGNEYAKHAVAVFDHDSHTIDIEGNFSFNEGMDLAKILYDWENSEGIFEKQPKDDRGNEQ